MRRRAGLNLRLRLFATPDLAAHPPSLRYAPVTMFAGTPSPCSSSHTAGPISGPLMTTASFVGPYYFAGPQNYARPLQPHRSNFAPRCPLIELKGLGLGFVSERDVVEWQGSLRQFCDSGPGAVSLDSAHLFAYLIDSRGRPSLEPSTFGQPSSA